MRVTIIERGMSMAVESKYYVHSSDKAALKALKAIPGFHQFVRAFMKIWSERQFRILNMSSNIRITDTQLSKYYEMLPPICEKLGIDVPELYLSLDVMPNSYTSGDTTPFIVMTSGLFETLPEELIPTVLAHECGHIACHHTLYRTMGNILFGGASSAARNFVPTGLVTLPLEIAFFYWMRCSELSADRAAVICDGTSEKMSEVCMRLAGYDRDIRENASKEEFIKQAEEYRKMIKDSAWNKTLEFLILKNESHPLMTVRALECKEWGNSDQFKKIMDGTYLNEEVEEETEEETPETEDTENEKKPKVKFELPKLIKMPKEKVNEESESISVPDEIRKYKELYDDGIITEEEFNTKKKQLLGL